MQNCNNFLMENKQKPISEQKKLLRQHYLTIREKQMALQPPDNWGPRQFYRALELLKIDNLEEFTKKRRIACYFPIKSELNLSQFAQRSWLFPKVTQDKKLLWFEYGDGKTNMTRNSFGILEKDDEYCFSLNENFLPLLCFVPGIVGTRDGYRLGYGGGFYDKFLHQYQENLTSVLCLPSKEFLVPSLPHEPHDEKVDLIVF